MWGCFGLDARRGFRLMQGGQVGDVSGGGEEADLWWHGEVLPEGQERGRGAGGLPGMSSCQSRCQVTKAVMSHSEGWLK
jgi:hypothetical protein